MGTEHQGASMWNELMNLSVQQDTCTGMQGMYEQNLCLFSTTAVCKVDVLIWGFWVCVSDVLAVPYMVANQELPS